MIGIGLETFGFFLALVEVLLFERTTIGRRVEESLEEDAEVIESLGDVHSAIEELLPSERSDAEWEERRARLDLLLREEHARRLASPTGRLLHRASRFLSPQTKLRLMRNLPTALFIASGFFGVGLVLQFIAAL